MIQISEIDGWKKLGTMGDPHPTCSYPKFSPDGKYLVASGYGKVKVWSTENWKEVFFTTEEFTDHVFTEFFMNGKYLLARDWAGNLVVWKTSTWNRVLWYPNNKDERWDNIIITSAVIKNFWLTLTQVK